MAIIDEFTDALLLLSVPCQMSISVTVEACNITGLKTIMEVDESDTVQSLKTEIYKIDGFKEYDPELRLFFRKDRDHCHFAMHRLLRDELTLSDYGIGHGSTIFVVLKRRPLPQRYFHSLTSIAE